MYSRLHFWQAVQTWHKCHCRLVGVTPQALRTSLSLGATDLKTYIFESYIKTVFNKKTRELIFNESTLRFYRVPHSGCCDNLSQFIHVSPVNLFSYRFLRECQGVCLFLNPVCYPVVIIQSIQVQIAGENRDQV